MERAIRIEDATLLKALHEGVDYLIVGTRRFRLVEVTETDDSVYVPTDPNEIALVKEAMQDTSPRLEGEAAREYLKARLKEYGVG